MEKLNECVFYFEVDDLSVRCNSIWNKKEVDGEPIYNKTFLDTKVRSYSDEATDSHDKKVPKYLKQALLILV